MTPPEFDPALLGAHALADTHHLPVQMFTSYDAAVDWLQSETSGPLDPPDASAPSASPGADDPRSTTALRRRAL